MLAYFKSVLHQDPAPVVLCDLDHKIIYMNPTACSRYGMLLGKNLLDCHNNRSVEAIKRVVAWFAQDQSHNRVHTFYNEKENKDVYMVALRDEQGTLIGYYEKHEYRNRDLTPLYTMP